jgi:beta-barrel assembly-enhancing protease
MTPSRAILLGAAALLLTACGVNPVTGEKELQFVSEAQELAIGAQNYAPTRQSQGGDLTVVPELTTYINEVGQKLAAVSDRQLPYEFVVLNNSVPNAWALPGGKIAVNRGLLTELENEAELAAVLGHEIVHAAARHGAKAQERGTLLQVGMAAAQIGAAVGGVDSNVAGLLIQGAGVGAQLIMTKYSREQELESDLYGMKYMKLAGYDPWGAVTLQETFVRLSAQGERAQSWLDGMFASHPPSAERVARNQQTAADLGRDGEVGAERYAQRIKSLMDLKPAYDKHDQAMAAARKKDFAAARKLAGEAAAAVPREGRFQEFLGEVALAEKQPQQAVSHYSRAIDLNPGYFGSYLGAGVAQLQLGNRAGAEEWLSRSMQLLPTAPAAFYLGQIERDKGNLPRALAYYKAAAGSDSAIGQQAAAEFVRLDLPQNPGNYVAAAGQLDAQGQLVVVIQNRSPVGMSDIQVTPVIVDAGGRIMSQGSALRIRGPVASGERAAAPTGIRLNPEQLAQVRFRIDSARSAP